MVHRPIWPLTRSEQINNRVMLFTRLGCFSSYAYAYAYVWGRLGAGNWVGTGWRFGMLWVIEWRIEAVLPVWVCSLQEELHV